MIVTWNHVWTKINICESVINLKSGAFIGCSGLTDITFFITCGWEVSEYSDMGNATVLSSDSLSNTYTAATYLTSTYYMYFWKRG